MQGWTMKRIDVSDLSSVTPTVGRSIVLLQIEDHAVSIAGSMYFDPNDEFAVHLNQMQRLTQQTIANVFLIVPSLKARAKMVRPLNVAEQLGIQGSMVEEMLDGGPVKAAAQEVLVSLGNFLPKNSSILKMHPDPCNELLEGVKTMEVWSTPCRKRRGWPIYLSKTGSQSKAGTCLGKHRATFPIM